MARRIRCYNDTESREFNSLSEASEKLDICIFSISVALKTHKEYRGYFFEYLDDDDNQIIRYLRNKSDFRVHTTDRKHLKDFIDPGEISIPKEDNLLLPTDYYSDEEWARIPGYPKTQVSNYHRFRLDIGNDLYRLLPQNTVFIDDEPYLQVFLSDGIQSTRCFVDRAIYATYVDSTFPIYEWNPDQIIHHINNNTLDNNPSNLKAIARNI